MNGPMRHGYRIVGPCSAERRLVDWSAAFQAYAECDPRARVESEAYLSAFTFGGDFAEHLRNTGSTRGFAGACWAPWLWFDIDRAPTAGGIDAALQDARKLAVALSDRYGVDDAAQLWFYSGAKGFHAGIPAALWAPAPSTDFHRVARRLAETIAEAAAVIIDAGVYDKVRAFRGPNSRHPGTGRHKVRLTTDELMHLSAAAILDRAEKPAPFDLPDVPADSADFLVAHWDTAAGQVREQTEAAAQRRAAVTDGDGTTKLNKLTLDFIRNGAAPGAIGAGDENRQRGAGRHRLCYSAAANLAELGAPLPLCFSLLEESALDCGLPPADVRRAVENGWASMQPGVREACDVFNGEVINVQSAPADTSAWPAEGGAA
ncbi:MAG: DNA primase [Phycisphaerales bacterium]|nr:DNA primase [Phycisphaerales bacterium]